MSAPNDGDPRVARRLAGVQALHDAGGGDLRQSIRRACVLLTEDPASGDPDADGLTAAGAEFCRLIGTPPQPDGGHRAAAEEAVARAREVLAERPALRRSLREAMA